MEEQNLDNKFELLRIKSILAILDGDTDFGELNIDDNDRKIRIAMPYLSGPMICELSTKFGFSQSYGWNGGAKSRWDYLDSLLKYSIDNGRESELLGLLFSKSQFANTLKGLPSTAIESTYNQILKSVIDGINGELYFGGNELVQVGNIFVIKEIGKTITVATPVVKQIDRDYISDLSNRAMEDVENEHYDSAITKSRTLIEEVFCYVIEKKNETPSESGDIGKLYKQVKDLYNMHADKNIDVRINTLLSGLEKILSSISEMRNKDSDSHGVGSKRINISEHHARLFVNSAMTMADFILSVAENSK